MKATRFPREYRLWIPEEKIFLEGEEVTKRGFTLTADGLPYYNQLPFECYVQWFTGFIDRDHKKIFEGDICEFEVSSGFGSMISKRAVMRWDNVGHQFALQMLAVEGGVVYDALNTVKVGNEFSHPELLAELIPS